MTPKPKSFRVFFFLLAFILAFAPTSAWAASTSSKTQKINYVSLGDSLAHGLLSDGKTFGTGFVGNIEKSLKSNGYEVNLTNKGYSGYTSEVVLNSLQQIDELKNANIVTISAGANDLLSQIDKNLLKKFKPDYLDPAKVAELKTAGKKETQNKFAEGKQTLAGLNQSIATAETQINGVVTNIKNTYGFLIPPDMQQALDDTIDNITDAKENGIEAASAFSEAKAAFEADNSNYKTLLDDSSDLLDSVIDNLNNILEILDNAKAYMDKIPQLKDVQTGITKLLAATENTKTKVTDVINTAASLEEIDEMVEKIPEIQQMLNNAQQKVVTVGENIGKIITYIKQVNPSADIYVMGYYNALPYLSKETQQSTVPLIQALNNAIQKATETSDATFVPTYSIFEGNYNKYLPNPENIHPNEQGYSAIAKAFMNEISKKYPSIIPSSVKINLGKKATVYKGQKVTINGTKTTIVMPNDLPDGTTLKVTKTTNSKMKQAKNLKSVGDALNFKFEYPSKSKNYKGKYKITMGYKSSSPDKVNIYYYDSKSKKWAKQNGKNDKKAKKVSLTVSKISDYGVFAKVEKSNKKK